jgi:hypothetical protein
MDDRNEQYEMAYRTARDIGQQFGRKSNGHLWGRIILKLFGELLDQDDEFLVECRVNGLVEEYLGLPRRSRRVHAHPHGLAG